MGTRSLTVFNNEMDNSEIVVLYRQYDGYPTGHGRDLFSFLNNIEIVNGISPNEKRKIANDKMKIAKQKKQLADWVAHYK